MLSGVVEAWLLVAWTSILWISRLRNVLNNPDLDSFGLLVRLAAVAGFVGLSLAAVWGVLVATSMWWTRVLAIWTIVFWFVRGVGILVDGYSAAFKLVHSGLAVFSITLAVLCLLRSPRKRFLEQG